jgi:hypothetical protein
MCVCETYIGKPFGTSVVPQFTTEVIAAREHALKFFL